MRADVYLVAQGVAKSRTLAQKLILSGSVRIDGQAVTKPSEDIPDGEHSLSVTAIDEMRYVSRGGLKLEAALSAFGVDVRGLVMADIGASTGGFTHCLLTKEAARVYAVDAGHGQLDASLARNPSVRSMEGINARYLSPEHLVAFEKQVSEVCLRPDGTPFSGVVDGVVMDVSFISQTMIHPSLAKILRPNGFLLTLIKPQFEVGASGLGKHGVVKDPKHRDEAVERVCLSAAACGFERQGIMLSPIQGGDGNVEYIGYFLKKN